jgi:cytochrome c oxidase cbb3-type subunit I/II
MRTVGVPYKPEQIATAARDARAAGVALASALKAEGGVGVAADSELIALVSYLQRLGRAPAPVPAPGTQAEPVEVAAGGAPERSGE